MLRENSDSNGLKRVGPTRSQPRQLWAGVWFPYGVPLLGCVPDGSVPPTVRSAVGYGGGFVAAVKPARDAIPLLLVHEAAAHARFQVRRDKVEEHQTTTARRADRRLQKLLDWEAESPGNLLHKDHYGTPAERARRRLARLDPIAESDDEDEVVAPDEAF